MDPFTLSTLIRVQAGSLAEGAQLVLDHLTASGFEPPVQWSASGGKWTPLASVKASIAALKRNPGKSTGSSWEASGFWIATIVHEPDEGPDVWMTHLSHECAQKEAPRLLNSHASLLRAIAQTGRMVRALVERENGGVLCLPDVPIASINAHILAIPPERPDLGYDYPERFLNAGWRKDAAGGMLFLERGLKATSNTAYLKEILHHQWAMARAAKPHQTSYYWPKVEANERKLFRSGDPALELVGYVVSEKTVEFSCVLESLDQHLQGWEIYDIFALLHEKKTADGDPVEAVRVVFFAPWMAEQEKRPLLDIGARVYYQAEDGGLIEVTE